MKRTALVVLAGVIAFVASSEAQNLEKLSAHGSVVPSSATAVDDCAGGLVYDDGGWEDGSGFNEVNVGRGSFVQRIDVAAGSSLKSVCICWARTAGDGTINFDINVWSANGPSGKPGTLLGTLPAQAAGVPQTVGGTILGKFYRYDLSALSITPGGNVYVGPAWNPKTDTDFFLCEDDSLLTPDRPVYIAASSVVGSPDTPPSIDPRLVNFSLSALGIRAEAETNNAACTPSLTALCLNSGRFRVEATFATPAGQNGPAQVVKLTDATGYFWFFNETNVEAVVKVLDACSLNGKYWVFAGGLTNVQVVITVTDTETGTSKTYTNPQGKAFLPIQDTAALPCN